ncbi:hypothetical protein TNCV_2835111 [Trichonephila clavipes]|uniref:Uncharacterized protein n=1 Tax=Trichonephila clavipes TaxID=2585209 RepID=A0A8X6V5L2_TRICX|nr:hypothetical protein TNCV_2835111 [Trichonephila clavipes]
MRSRRCTPSYRCLVESHLCSMQVFLTKPVAEDWQPPPVVKILRIIKLALKGTRFEEIPDIHQNVTFELHPKRRPLAKFPGHV